MLGITWMAHILHFGPRTNSNPFCRASISEESPMPIFCGKQFVEFFGGPWDGLQQAVDCQFPDLDPTVSMPLPCIGECDGLPTKQKPRSEKLAVYELTQHRGCWCYRFAGRRGNGINRLPRLAGWLQRLRDFCRHTIGS
jgi:hypothetical protein